MSDYQRFLSEKRIKQNYAGFKPIWLPDGLFAFQRTLVEWAIKMGRCALFEDCGLGKGYQLLVWCENILRKTNKPVLIAAPLAVSRQFVSEAEKFGIAVHRTQTGKIKKGVINVTNYERLHLFDPKDVVALGADEGGIVKNFDGKTRLIITRFAQKVKYFSLWTATPAPNDHMELGCSAEAIGVMSRSQMLGTFFTNTGDSTQQWELKGHARTRFWEWVATWARAIRKPSDFGFADEGFILPGLEVESHFVDGLVEDGFLPKEAVTLDEQRQESKRTVKERCEKVLELIPKNRPFIAWCHRNDEGDLLEKIIPGAIQVAGRHKDEEKEERLWAFTSGEAKVLVTKPKIAGFGLNWQHCSDMAFFPTHSHEALYQSLRRCYRFGQKRTVTCHIVASESESRIMTNMLRKERQSQQLYDGIIRSMQAVLDKKQESNGHVIMRLPKWLSK